MMQTFLCLLRQQADHTDRTMFVTYISLVLSDNTEVTSLMSGMVQEVSHLNYVKR